MYRLPSIVVVAIQFCIRQVLRSERQLRSVPKLIAQSGIQRRKGTLKDIWISELL